MAVNNHIFDAKLGQESVIKSPFITNQEQGLDEGVLSPQEAFYMNTYLNWGIVQIPTEPDSEDKDLPHPDKYGGVKSLFNNVHAIRESSMMGLINNAPLLDTPGGRRVQRERTNCSIRSLVEGGADGSRGRAIYDYSDFAYCKYLNRVSNNYLITLRRFPNPCGDHIDYHFKGRMNEDKINDHAPDIGRMVTWLGTPGNEMSSILKYSYKMNWREMKSGIEDTQIEEQSSPLATIFNMTDANYQKQVQQGLSGAGVGNTMDMMLTGIGMSGQGNHAPYTNLRDFRDKNKVYGPVDVITATHMRDIGLEFTHEFTLTFDYELRSYDGINGKAAILDLLGNVLAVTYNNGPFWRGGYHYLGAHQSNLFANLPLFKDASAGKLTSWNALSDSFSASIAAVGNHYTDNGKKNLKEVAKDILNGIGGMLIGGALNKLGRPAKAAANSLVSDAPVGCWHVTIGNPNAPILEMGNMIVKDASIEHYGPMGIDDFPTGLKVTVTLTHGMGRDSGKIERMYTHGDNRIYSPMNKGIAQLYEGAMQVRSNSQALASDNQALAETNRKNNQRSAKDAIENKNATKSTPLTSSLCPGETSMYLRYFGTKNSGRVMNGAMEACFGQGEKPQKSK